MRGGPGLFEIVTGHFANGMAIEDVDASTQTFLSVMDNVQRILDSRRGGLVHLPHYGLGDLSRIYCHLPASVHALKHQIETTLLRYEPRIKAIDLVIDDTEPGMLVSFTMSCHLRQSGLVRFGTHFTPDGKTRLELLRAANDRD
jgi:type VI secretion system protein